MLGSEWVSSKEFGQRQTAVLGNAAMHEALMRQAQDPVYGILYPGLSPKDRGMTLLTQSISAKHAREAIVPPAADRVKNPGLLDKLAGIIKRKIQDRQDVASTRKDELAQAEERAADNDPLVQQMRKLNQASSHYGTPVTDRPTRPSIAGTLAPLSPLARQDEYAISTPKVEAVGMPEPEQGQIA